MREVCETYRAAPARLKDEGIHTVSVDEKTGIQALERKSPTKPMRPGVPERREFEYRRHGTQCLTANLEVSTGRVIAPTVQATRNEADFAAHIGRTIATDPTAGWIFVADNLTTHGSATLVLLIAGLCALPTEALGKKGKSGVLESHAEAHLVAEPGGDPTPPEACQGNSSPQRKIPEESSSLSLASITPALRNRRLEVEPLHQEGPLVRDLIIRLARRLA